MLLSVSIINLIASGDATRSTAALAVVIGNILLHVVSIAVDFSERIPRTAGWWAGLIIHIALILAFGSFLLDWNG
jgi:hypothetical protein